jgi:tetratricopeptide (TPR) repeat protein
MANRASLASGAEDVATGAHPDGEPAEAVPPIIEPVPLEAGDAVFPSDPRFAIAHAYNAQHCEDWPEAIRRWEAIREHFPDQQVAYTEGAVCLDKAGRYQELEALYGETSERFPGNERATIEFAWLAHHRRDWPTAIARWQTVRERFPGHLTGYLGYAYTLMEANRPADADALLEGGLSDDPNHPELLIAYARQAQQQKDWLEALRRFAIVVERVPARVSGFVGHAEALSQLGRSDEAQAILRDAVVAFSEDPTPFAEYARVAARQERYVEAVQRWEDAVRRFPNDVQLSADLFAARLRLADIEPDSGVKSQDEGETASDTGGVDTRADAVLGPCDLVMQFESLGGAGHGCEFGIFQRSFGAEPLGLLRWADLGPEQLATALEMEFDGVGLPENTELFVPPTSGEPEYWTRDLRYWMVMRTFVPVADIAEDEMRSRVCRRLQFLRRKLADDLRAGSKIFVYKNLRRNLTEAEIERLHRAMQRYGDNRLLYIRYEDAGHPTARSKSPHQD